MYPTNIFRYIYRKELWIGLGLILRSSRGVKKSDQSMPSIWEWFHLKENAENGYFLYIHAPVQFFSLLRSFKNRTLSMYFLFQTMQLAKNYHYHKSVSEINWWSPYFPVSKRSRNCIYFLYGFT